MNPTIDPSASAGTDFGTDPKSGNDVLARAVLPVLLHELANVTQMLTGLRAILTMEGGDALFAGRGEDLVRGGEVVEDLGWAMAVLGSAAGSDMLLARREARGLEIMLALVHKVCSRDGIPLTPFPESLPSLAPGCLDGWQLPWALGTLLLGAASDGGEVPTPWTLTAKSGGGAIFRAPAGPAVEVLKVCAEAALPGATLDLADDGWLEVHLPEGWLRF